MKRSELAVLVRTLGAAFVARQMTTQTRKLRLYYLALRYGLTESRNRVDLQWSEDFVLEWMRVLDLPPYAGAYEHRRAGAGCPKCPEPPPMQAGERHSSPRATVRTLLVFPGGAKMECVRCGYAWIAESAPPAPP